MGKQYRTFSLFFLNIYIHKQLNFSCFTNAKFPLSSSLVMQKQITVILKGTPQHFFILSLHALLDLILFSTQTVSVN